MSPILVVGPSWVGDMVMAQSLFKTLKQRSPEAPIDVLAPAWSEALTTRMPEVRRSIVMPLGHGQLQLRERYRLGRDLRTVGYEQAIVLPNSWKSALIPFFARIPRRTGYLGEARWGLLNDARRLDKAALPMTVQRFVALGIEPDQPLVAPGILPPATLVHPWTSPEPLPLPSLVVTPSSVTQAVQRLQLEIDTRPILALCPGAEFGAAKRWPQEYYAEVAQSLIARGWQVWLFGSEKDTSITGAIKHGTGADCIDLAGRTTLAEAVDLLSLATLVVSNDSGLMHVAAALGRKLIAIYGSSDPGFTPPLSSTAHILRLGLECSPCFQRECPLGHLKCLREIGPAQVLQTITAMTA
ncbi:MAG: lipopolysaccharide heptosyltransferase II [Gammaproteobacteria bacterium]